MGALTGRDHHNQGTKAPPRIAYLARSLEWGFDFSVLYKRGTQLAIRLGMPDNDQKRYLLFHEILIRVASPSSLPYLTQNSLRFTCPRRGGKPSQDTTYCYTTTTLSHSKDKIK